MSRLKMTTPSEQEITVIDRQESSMSARDAGSPPWVRVLVVVGILAVLTLPIFWSQKQDAKSDEVEDSNLGLYAVICEDTEGIFQQESDFLQWLHSIEPSQWYYPSQDGFSGYNRRDPLPSPILKGYTQQEHPLPAPAETSTRLMEKIPPMDGREFLNRPVFIEIPEAPRTAQSDVLPARWRRVGGGSLANPPAFTSEELALLDNPDVQARLLENQCSPTRLEVQFRSGISLPRVLTRGSCGVPELDSAAVNALRRSLSTSGLAEQVFSPAVIVFLEIDWRM